jgi:hypothetical protein
MFNFRSVLFSTLIFAVVPPFVLRGDSNTILYVGGTVKSIPADAVGSFDFDDTRELKFLYHGGFFAVPYEQITSTEVTKSEPHHLLRKIPAPAFGRRKQTMTIAFKDAAGAAGTLSFEVTENQASIASDTIEAKKAFAAASSIPSNDWWGDRYWKTNRNKSNWQMLDQVASAPPAQPTNPATK